MKIFVSVLASASLFAILPAATPAFADAPDGLTLPPGFHATVVADGLGAGVRHLAFRDKDTLYISTARSGKDAPNAGIIAVHLDRNHKAETVQHFGTVDGGTSIVVHDGALYAASATTLYRFAFNGTELAPSAQPQTVIDGITRRPAVAFDDKGGVYVAVGGAGNICTDPKAPKDAAPVGINPCPDMDKRSGIWRFDAGKTGQHFPADGVHFTTGIRDLNAVAWKPGVGLYTAMYGRDGTEKAFPKLVSAADGANISDEMFLVGQDANMGWPYTYWDSARNIRLAAPEYGGDGKTPVTALKYAVPVAAFGAHVAPMDLAFYNAKAFPAQYRGGAFVPFHGAAGDAADNDLGYSVGFVPFHNRVAGKPVVFANGFAGPDKAMRNGRKATYRPVGVAVGPDGALYVADSQKGRIWRIAYGK